MVNAASALETAPNPRISPVVDPTRALPALKPWMISGRNGLRIEPATWSAAITAKSDNRALEDARGRKSGTMLSRMDLRFAGGLKLSFAQRVTMTAAARSRTDVAKKLTRRRS